MEKDIQKNELFKMYRQTGKSQINFMYYLKYLKNCGIPDNVISKLAKDCGIE